MITGLPRIGAMLAAVIFARSVFGFSLFVWRSFGGVTPLQPEGYRVHVPFGGGGAQLFPNADVRIAGVKVGRVTAVRAEGLRTDAEVELEERYAPLAADARAIIRTKTLLGETFVALTPGSASAPRLPEGASLRPGQIEESQGVDEVLATFDAPTRGAFRAVLIDLARALDGRSGDLNTTLGNAAPATEELRRLLEVVRAREGEVGDVVRDSGTVLRGLAARRDALRRLVTAGDEVLGATAARDRELEATVRALPGFLRDARATLATAEATAIDAAPTLRALRPVAPLLLPALRDAEALLPDVARLAREAGPLAAAARRGTPSLVAVLDAARPATRALVPAARELVPVLQTVDAYKSDAVSSLAKAAAATQYVSGGRHLLRALLLFTNESFYGQEQRAPTSRANAYVKPGGLERLVEGGPLRTLSCANTRNPETIPPILSPGPPPCAEQGPWTLRGKTATFPGVERDAP